MCRFASLQDEGYRSLSAVLKILAEDALVGVSDRKPLEPVLERDGESMPESPVTVRTSSLAVLEREEDSIPGSPATSQASSSDESITASEYLRLQQSFDLPIQSSSDRSPITVSDHRPLQGNPITAQGAPSGRSVETSDHRRLPGNSRSAQATPDRNAATTEHRRLQLAAVSSHFHVLVPPSLTSKPE